MSNNVKKVEMFKNVNFPLMSTNDVVYTHVLIGKSLLTYDYFVINHPVNKDYIDSFGHMDNKVLHEKIINVDDSYYNRNFSTIEKIIAQEISSDYDCVISAHVGIPRDIELSTQLKSSIGYPFVSSLMGLHMWNQHSDKIEKIKLRDEDFHNSLEVHMLNYSVGIGDFKYEHDKGIYSTFKYLDFSYLNYNNYRFPYDTEFFNNDNVESFQLNLLWYYMLNRLMESENNNTTIGSMLSDKVNLQSIIDNVYTSLLNFDSNEYPVFLAYMITAKNNPLNISFYNTVEKRNLLLQITKNDILELFKKSTLIRSEIGDYYTIEDISVSYCKVFKDDNVVRLNNTLSYWLKQLRHASNTIDTVDSENIMETLSRAYIRNISTIHSKLLEDYNSLNSSVLEDIIRIQPLDFQSASRFKASEIINIASLILDIFGKDYIEKSIKLSHLYTLIELSRDERLFPDITFFEVVELFKRFNGDKCDNESLLNFFCSVYVNFDSVRLSVDFIDSDDDISTFNDLNPEMFFNIHNISYNLRDDRYIHNGHMAYHVEKLRNLGF